jgi:chemotaxis protein histidine kinase CheA
MNRKKGEFDDFDEGGERIDFVIDPEAVTRAESIVASMSEEYLDWLRADLDELDGTLSEARGSVRAVDQLRRKAHDIRGQGGSFGFPLISEVADALYKVMVSQDDILSAEGETLTRGLFETLRLVVERQARGDGDIQTREAVARAVTSVDAAYGGTSC